VPAVVIDEGATPKLNVVPWLQVKSTVQRRTTGR
jgi:hypothetical protein